MSNVSVIAKLNRLAGVSVCSMRIPIHARALWKVDSVPTTLPIGKVTVTAVAKIIDVLSSILYANLAIASVVLST
jgi:hypothetical protein